MLKPYDGYKETTIPWLEEVPSHWESKKINELFKERKSKVSDKDFAPLSVTKKELFLNYLTQRNQMIAIIENWFVRETLL